MGQKAPGVGKSEIRNVFSIAALLARVNRQKRDLRGLKSRTFLRQTLGLP